MSVFVLPEQKKTKPSRLIYILFCCVFCGMYFARDVLDIKISYYVIYAIAAFIMLTVQRAEAIAFFVSLSAFTSAGFDGVFCTIMLGCILIRFFKDIKSVKLYSLLLVLMCVMEFLHYYALKQTGFGTILTYMTILLTLAIIQQCPDEEIDKNLIVNSFIAFSLFFVLMTMIQMIEATGSFRALLESGYRTEDYTDLREADGLTGNQNFITQLCSMNMCLCMLMLSKKMPKLIYIVAIGIFLVSGFLTVSKMFMVVIAAFVLYVAVMALRKDTLKGLGVIALLFIAGFVVLRLMGNALLDQISYRFAHEELTSGRVAIIADMFAYMREHPQTYLFGTGVKQLGYLISAGVHSSFFEVIGGWGIIGLLLVGFYISGLVSHARSAAIAGGNRPNGYNYLPLLMCLGYSLIGMLFSSAFAVVKMMVCIYAIGIKERETNVIQHHNAGI